MIAQRIQTRAQAYRRAILTYTPNNPDRCNICGGTAWLVGRGTAECAGCGDARLITDGRSAAGGGVLVRSRTDVEFQTYQNKGN